VPGVRCISINSKVNLCPFSGAFNLHHVIELNCSTHLLYIIYVRSFYFSYYNRGNELFILVYNINFKICLKMLI